MLTFEYTLSGSVEVYMDDVGKEKLLSILSRISQIGDHEHLMTISWGAGELDEEVHKPENTIVNMVTLGKVLI